MFNRCKTLLLAAGLTLSLGTVSQAALQAVGPVDFANGFPLWFQDANLVQLKLNVGTPFSLAAPPIPGNAFSQRIGFGPEAFYWSAGASVDTATGQGLLVMAQEAAFATGDPSDGAQIVFARIRLRVDVPISPSTVTVTHPFGTTTCTLPAGTNVINDTIDIIGDPTQVPPFLGALGAVVPAVNVDPNCTTAAVWGPFLSWAGAPAPPVGFLGSPLVDHAITAGPSGAAFTIAGGGIAANTTLFALEGNIFQPIPNLAPIVNADVVATAVATPVTINVLANDRDVTDAAAVAPIPPAATNIHGINPKAVRLVPAGAIAPFTHANTASTITTAAGGTAATNVDGTITYTPLVAFSGVDVLTYAVQDTGGLVATAAAIVTAEQLQAQAAFRTKVQKWKINGTSSIAALQANDAAGNPILFTKLVGAQEVPPHVSAGNGDVSVTLRPGVDTLLGTADDLIDYSLSYTGLVDALQAHIHSGPIAANGPPAVFLCSNTVGGIVPACPATGGTVTGTLTVANLIPSAIPAGGTAATTFTQLIADIMAGITYVNVHTTAFAGGEIRGQIGRNVVAVHDGPTTASPLLGVTAVPPLTAQTSAWSLPAKIAGVPSVDRTVTVQTSAGSTLTVPLKLK